MAKGGKFLMHPVPFFNGRLFDDTDVPDEIHGEHVRLLEELNDLNWADVEPSIFGTLFERVIDPAQRRADRRALHLARRHRAHRRAGPHGAAETRMGGNTKERRRSAQTGASSLETLHAAHRRRVCRRSTSGWRPSACSIPPAAPATSSTSRSRS